MLSQGPRHQQEARAVAIVRVVCLADGRMQPDCAGERYCGLLQLLAGAAAQTPGRGRWEQVLGEIQQQTVCEVFNGAVSLPQTRCLAARCYPAELWQRFSAADTQAAAWLRVPTVAQKGCGLP